MFAWHRNLTLEETADYGVILHQVNIGFNIACGMVDEYLKVLYYSS